nr:PAS domain S-box protein [uncultured Rhodoferax sp.]
MLLCNPVYAAQETRVLLIASYHAGMAWSDAQIDGIRQELAPLQPAVDLQVEFLDTKRITPSERYYLQFETLLLAKMQAQPPALILAVDDDGLDMALRLRNKHYPRLPVLFSGVSISRRAALADLDQVGGVFDDLDIGAGLGQILQLRPQTRKLWVIHDPSRTSLAQVETLREVLRPFDKLQVEYLTGMDAAAIQTQLGQTSTEDLVLALTFNKDSGGRLFSHEEAADLWAASSRAPVIVTRALAMRPGILGGYLVSGDEQGQAVGRLAWQILSGQISSPLPLIPAQGKPTFDYLQLLRWKIDMGRLPHDSVVLNRPSDPWEALRPHKAWLMALFGSLLIIIGLLVFGMYNRRAAERAIRASELKYRELFDHSPDAIIVREVSSGRVVDTNPRFEAMFGYSASEALLLQTHELTAMGGEFNVETVKERFAAVLRGERQVFEWHQRRKDGSIFWSEISMVCIGRGSRSRTVSTVRDISDRKRAEQLARELEHRIRQVYENLPIAVFAIDAEHTVTFWNPQMTRLTGVPASEVVGTKDSWRGTYKTARPTLVNLLVDGASPEALQHYYPGKLRPSADLPGALEGEDLFTNMDGTASRWGRYCAAPLRDADGTIYGGLETVIDVTELKHIQTNLQDLNRELEVRVEARNQELQRAMGQLVQSEKLVALGSLVAGVAHELNTPIGNVMAVASTLTEEVAAFGQKLVSGTARRSEVQAITKRIEEASLLIERNASRAGKLINDFKEVAVDQTSSRRRHFALRAIVQEVLHTAKPMFKATNHVVELHIPEDLEMDSYPGPLEQVLTNLLSNSLRHGFEGTDSGLITIEAQAHDTQVLLHYSDNGCGIPATSLPHVFEPFYTTKLGSGGSGLGMYLVYNLVTNILGGVIGIESEKGAGTHIRIAIPRLAPMHTVEPAHSPAIN